MIDSYGRLMSVRMEWHRDAMHHSSLMRLSAASDAVAIKSLLFHLSPDYFSRVVCWISVPSWIADLDRVSVNWVDQLFTLSIINKNSDQQHNTDHQLASKSEPTLLVLAGEELIRSSHKRKSIPAWLLTLRYII
ncbi:hypothetical protein BHM03_00003400 [Ensete ventricosum]|nr:hypothetical protein BHM03_00003400 [Ensete ventricosum]